jgi:hypothetical protein
MLNKYVLDSHTEPHLRTQPFPKPLLSAPIHFSIIPGNETHKLSHIQVPDIATALSISTFITQHNPIGKAYPSPIHPSTGTTPTHIDTTPPANNYFPTNCRITGCVLHQMGFEEQLQPGTEEDTIQSLETHGINFHSDLLTSLPSNILNEIHWFKCPACAHLFFTHPRLDVHDDTCEQRKQHPPNVQADDTTTLKPNSNQLNTNTDSDMRTRLLLVCPPEFKDQLHVLLNSETDIKDNKEQVLDWMMETSPRHPDSTQEK